MHISFICKTAYIVLLLKIVVFKLSSLNICFKPFTNLFSSSVHSGTLLTHFTHLPKYLENLTAEHNRTCERIQMQESYLKYRESLFSYAFGAFSKVNLCPKVIKQLIYPTADISQGEIRIICGVTETGKLRNQN